MSNDAGAILSGAALIGLLVTGLTAWACKEQERQDALIKSGVCKAVAEEVYHPPPTMICTVRSKGACIAYVPIQRDPYPRTLWRCGTEEFWRKSE